MLVVLVAGRKLSFCKIEVGSIMIKEYSYYLKKRKEKKKEYSYHTTKDKLPPSPRSKKA
jgi:hypothetical protein